MLNTYLRNKEIHRRSLTSTVKKQRFIGYIRLILACVCIASIMLYIGNSRQLYLYLTIVALIIFFSLVKLFIGNENKIILQKRLIKINEDEILYLRDGVLNFDSGEEFIDSEHPYSFDLDIFGIGSIFQHVNRSSTFLGHRWLANHFIRQNVDKITEIQTAVKELSTAIDWRQDFSAKGKIHISTEKNINNFKRWLVAPLFYNKRFYLVVIYYLLPALSVGSLLVGVLLKNFIPFFILFFTNLLVTLFNIKKFKKEFLGLEGTGKILLSYSHLLKCIENSSFNARLLDDLKSRIYRHNTSAAGSIGSLANILSRFDSQNNLLGSLITNGLALSAIHDLLSLEKWRSNYSKYVDEWMDVIAEWDALNSLANYYCNNADFIFPRVEFTPMMNMEGAGHPLIKKENRVLNDIIFDSETFVILTGSNMSGKSTFLRVIGVNLLLFRMGAPICVKSAGIYPFEIFVSMKINDSLANNESLFFAELKRLRRIIDQIKSHLPTFVLLDEVLKGTNSNDKHTGTRSLIEKIARYKTFGIIATHDLTISEMVMQHPEYLINKCFEVEIKNDQLYFDYKLKEGVCKKMSAVFLMKQMEII